MGLDMYAYKIQEDFKFDGGVEEEELMYWRKHHDLHGWMEQLYMSSSNRRATRRPGLDTSPA